MVLYCNCPGLFVWFEAGAGWLAGLPRFSSRAFLHRRKNAVTACFFLVLILSRSGLRREGFFILGVMEKGLESVAPWTGRRFVWGGVNSLLPACWGDDGMYIEE